MGQLRDFDLAETCQWGSYEFHTLQSWPCCRRQRRRGYASRQRSQCATDEQFQLQQLQSGASAPIPRRLGQKIPIRLRVPSSGTWHVTIDMQGLRGTARSSIRVIPGEALKPLPAINETPLRDMPTLIRNTEHDLVPATEAPDGRVFDVFISHASEDKEEVVRPLSIALQSADSASGTMSSNCGLATVFAEKSIKDWRAAASA